MRRLLTLVSAAVCVLAMMAGPAAAAKPASTPDTDCLRSGQAVLRSLDAFPAAARGEVNYAEFDATGSGDIRTELGDEAFLPINQVFLLHLNSPELFSWCD